MIFDYYKGAAMARGVPKACDYAARAFVRHRTRGQA